MYPPCVSVNEFLIPETRKRITKVLKNNGYKEKEIANILRVSQGMVSRYLHDKNSNLLSSELDAISENISKKIIEKYDEKDITEFFCNFCINLRESYKFCGIHKINNCNLCTYLYNPERNSEKNLIINNLNFAFNSLSMLPMEDLIPEVRMNMAYALKNAKSIMDVAAFPGRITYADGKLITYSKPSFGSSKHLSNILLAIKNKNPEINAVINIKYSEGILNKLNHLGNKILIMDRRKFNKIEDFILSSNEDFDTIVDPGEFGIEPMVYLFAEQPIKLVEKIEKLLKMEVKN